ncbi:hypothetical protein KFL_001540060 [Klebsormidium nitens]|uniref:Uncharacterized protein n=1 Tax=Klebsormidium nitens TaxID=105231 RepID=A0A1Y1I657_KLENI|nr:hypothetical protein KFL_001540060 [Klebsormidium nitens]|eukprot:GAQ83588.1 hypothetical protein KFL_001540060 [Klebsormidium nitens]
MAAAIGAVSKTPSVSCCHSIRATQSSLSQSNDATFSVSYDLGLPRRKSYLSGVNSRTRFGQRRASGSIQVNARESRESVRFQAVQRFSPNGHILLERTGHGFQESTPPFATVSVVARRAGLPPPTASEGLITEAGPVGILEPEEMELWLSEVEWVDPRVDIDPISISRAARLQMKADAAASTESAPRRVVTSVRKALPPSVGGSPQRFTAFAAAVLLVLALLWALFRKKAPQTGAVNSAYGNSPPGTGPSGVAKSGGQYSALKSARADASYKVRQAGSVATDANDEAKKRAQESLADLRKRVENVKRADDKFAQVKKEAKEEPDAGKKTIKGLVKEAEKRVEGSTGRNGTGDSLKSSGGVKTQPANGGAREDGSSGRSGSGDSLKAGVSKTVISGVKGAPTKGNEQLVKSAVGDPKAKLSAKPLPEKNETPAPSTGGGWQWPKKQETVASGVEGADPKKLESLVTESVGNPSETEQGAAGSKPAAGSVSPLKANSADAVLRGVTQKPENGASVTAPKTPLQVNSADSVLSGAQKSPNFGRGSGELSSEIEGLSKLLKQGEKPRADQASGRGPSRGSDDVASLMSELSSVMQASKKSVAASRERNGSSASADVISSTPTTPQDGPGAKMLAASSTKSDAVSKTPAQPLGGSPQMLTAKAGGSDAISKTPTKPVANAAAQAPNAAQATKPVQASKPVETSKPAATPNPSDNNNFFNALPWIRGGGNAGVLSQTPTKPLDGSDTPAIPAASGSVDVTSRTPTSSATGSVNAKPSSVNPSPATTQSSGVLSQTPTGSIGSGLGQQTGGKASDVNSQTPTTPAESAKPPEGDAKSGRPFSWFRGKNDQPPGASVPAVAEEQVTLPVVRETPLPPVVSERAPLSVARPTPPLPVFKSSAAPPAVSEATKTAETDDDAKRRSDLKEAQDILRKILVEDLPLPKPKKERAQLVAKIQNVLPAVAMSVGAAGAFTTGLDGALETVGFAALASFSYSTLLWASNREGLKKDIEEIKSSKDLAEFLKEKDITPEL